MVFVMGVKEIFNILCFWRDLGAIFRFFLLKNEEISMICYDTLKIFEIKLGFRIVFALLERGDFRKFAETRYRALCEIKVPKARCGFKY